MRSQEGLEILLTASSFDYQLSVLFTAEGVWQLVKDQQGQQLARKNLGAMLQSLPLFDVTSIFVEADSLKQRHLTLNDLILSPSLVNNSKLSAMLPNFDVILSY